MNQPRLFTLIRQIDETGVSGTGRILDGVVFHTGQVVICWRTDINRDPPAYSSIAVYPSWDAFRFVHIRPHAEGAAEVLFGDEVDFEKL
jgi:hypothetical protein